MNTFDDLLFDGEGIWFFVIVKVDERWSDFEEKLIHFLLSFNFEFTFRIFYSVSFFVVLLVFNWDLYHEAEVLNHDVNVIFGKESFWEEFDQDEGIILMEDVLFCVLNQIINCILGSAVNVADEH